MSYSARAVTENDWLKFGKFMLVKKVNVVFKTSQYTELVVLTNRMWIQSSLYINKIHLQVIENMQIQLCFLLEYNSSKIIQNFVLQK